MHGGGCSDRIWTSGSSWFNAARLRALLVVRLQNLDPRAYPIALRVCSCTPLWLILGDPLPLGALEGSPPPTLCSAGLSPSGFGSSLGPGRQQRAVLWVNPNFPPPRAPC